MSVRNKPKDTRFCCVIIIGKGDGIWVVLLKKLLFKNSVAV